MKDTETNKKKYGVDAHVFDEFKDSCLANGFTRRGKAFFRIVGEGVLQVLKYDYEPRPPHHDLNFGLFSMYGELQERWFTSGGSISRYTVVNLIGQADAEKPEMIDENGYYVPIHERLISPEEQLEVLTHEGFEKLNRIATQKQLAEAMCQLDIVKGSRIKWNDDLKFDPYLYCGDFEKAALVIQAILNQHSFALERAREYESAKEFEESLAWVQKMDQPLLEILRMIQDNDQDALRERLRNNFERNTGYAKFIRTASNKGRGFSGGK